MNQEQFIALIREHQSGNKRAQFILYPYLVHIAKGVFFMRGFSNSMAWDDSYAVANEKIMKIFNMQFEDGIEGTVWAYIRKVFENGFIDEIRIQKSNKNMVNARVNEWDEENRRFNSNDCFDFAVNAGPNQIINEREFNQCYENAINDLGPVQQRVFVLSVIECREVQEIMEVLNLNRNQVYANKSIAIKNVVDYLNKSGFAVRVRKSRN